MRRRRPSTRASEPPRTLNALHLPSFFCCDACSGCNMCCWFRLPGIGLQHSGHLGGVGREQTNGQSGASRQQCVGAIQAQALATDEVLGPSVVLRHRVNGTQTSAARIQVQSRVAMGTAVSENGVFSTPLSLSIAAECEGAVERRRRAGEPCMPGNSPGMTYLAH